MTEQPEVLLPQAPAADNRRWNPFRRWWMQWATLLAGLVAPAIYAGQYSEIEAPSIGLIVFCVFAGLLLCGMVTAFDPGSLPAPSRPSLFLGVFEKILTLAHALLAIKMALIFFGDDQMYEQRELSVISKVLILAWLWITAAALYLAGDIHIRAAGNRQRHF